MSRIVWDLPGSRKYETGVDRGVLYTGPSGGVPGSLRPGVAWNGLTGIQENFNRETESIYYDGVKVQELVTLGEFSGTLTAISYPKEFETLEGYLPIACGASLGEQPAKRFSLCYRTMVGDDLRDLNQYKLHLVYNLRASPSTKSRQTITDTPSIAEMSWDVTAIPEEFVLEPSVDFYEDYPIVRPTAELIVDSRKIDPLLLDKIEKILYGSPYNAPYLPTMQDMIQLFTEWARLKITDNGDGTWTAFDIPEQTGVQYVFEDDDDFFHIDSPTAIMIDDDTYTIESITCVGSESLVMEFIDNGDGTWTARTQYDALISVDEDTGVFTLLEVDPDLSGPDTYRLSDKYADTL